MATSIFFPLSSLLNTCNFSSSTHQNMLINQYPKLEAKHFVNHYQIKKTLFFQWQLTSKCLQIEIELSINLPFGYYTNTTDRLKLQKCYGSLMHHNYTFVKSTSDSSPSFLTFDIHCHHCLFKDFQRHLNHSICLLSYYVVIVTCDFSISIILDICTTVDSSSTILAS